MNPLNNVNGDCTRFQSRFLHTVIVGLSLVTLYQLKQSSQLIYEINNHIQNMTNASDENANLLRRTPSFLDHIDQHTAWNIHHATNRLLQDILQSIEIQIEVVSGTERSERCIHY